ncbi:transporter [Desulfomarina profundi]|uniref:Transporter n=1 Tax=Desulfomarina profundi TaxID=2772557 RepID=A0A8D5JNW9_9BACT|nr:AEC family transporter [Desulfomarina profundi]BCL63112.1 transporter [Desulfomarina profundi]
MEVITTITPIFIIILLGWAARKKGFITSDFLRPANQLVYYLSIPAMIFNSISKASFQEQFDVRLLFLTLLAASIIYVSTHLLTGILKMTPDRAGTFVQSCGHGNLGYIGLPIALYYLGDSGLAKAGIICGFLMILQNLMSVIILQLHSEKEFHGYKFILIKLCKNPVIISAMAGIAVSALALPVPGILSSSFTILGGLAPPMALLLIGASISMKLIKEYLRPTLGAAVIKLLFLPALGLVFFRLTGLTSEEFLPALILLCSPTATLAYVMAKEMQGDAEFAVATVSASTLFSSVTFVLWLAVV